MLILLDPNGLGSCHCILESAPPDLGLKIQGFVNARSRNCWDSRRQTETVETDRDSGAPILPLRHLVLLE